MLGKVFYHWDIDQLRKRNRKQLLSSLFIIDNPPPFHLSIHPSCRISNCNLFKYFLSILPATKLPPFCVRKFLFLFHFWWSVVLIQSTRSAGCSVVPPLNCSAVLVYLHHFCCHWCRLYCVHNLLGRFQCIFGFVQFQCVPLGWHFGLRLPCFVSVSRILENSWPWYLKYFCPMIFVPPLQFCTIHILRLPFLRYSHSFLHFSHFG